MIRTYRTLEATGEILGLPAHEVRDLIENGPLVGIERDGELKVHADDLEYYLRNRPHALASRRRARQAASFLQPISALCKPAGKEGSEESEPARELQLAAVQDRGVAKDSPAAPARHLHLVRP